METALARYRGYPHAIIEVDERAEYLSALEEANAGHCEPFAVFVLRCVERSIRWLIGETDHVLHQLHQPSLSPIAMLGNRLAQQDQ